MTPDEVVERADEITAETRYRLQFARQAAGGICGGTPVRVRGNGARMAARRESRHRARG